MPDDELPLSWIDLLFQADDRLEDILSLIEHDPQPEAEQIAERLADLGFFKVVSAKRYQLTDAGREILIRSPRSKRRKKTITIGWLHKLLSRR